MREIHAGGILRKWPLLLVTGPSEGILSVNPLISAEYREASRMVSMLNEAAFAFTRDVGCIVDWNRQAQDLLGYSEGQAKSLGLAALLGPDAASKATGIPTAPARRAIRAHDATLLPAVISFSPLGEGSEALILAIVGTDLDGLITSWNPSAERLFGYSAEEVLARPCQSLFAHEHGPKLAVALGQVRQGTASQRVEVIAKTKDGASQAVWVSPSRITDESGGTAGLSMTVNHATTR